MSSEIDPPSDNPDIRPKNWCGTHISTNMNKEDQVPIADDDADVIPQGREYYPCQTQVRLQETFGSPQVDEQNNDPDGPERINVGWGPIIPRWTPSKLLWFAVRAGFPSDEDFDYTVTSFEEAAGEWNAIDFGLTFEQTSDRKAANFLVKYIKPTDPKLQRVLASAFFPNNVEDVLVYDFTLVSQTWRPRLRNTFLHEIGHIIGLRHEFAIKPDRFGNGPETEFPAKLFGSENPNSVMSYEDVNEIQDTDREDVVKFYKLPVGYVIQRAKVTDYKPKPLPE